MILLLCFPLRCHIVACYKQTCTWFIRQSSDLVSKIYKYSSESILFYNTQFIIVACVVDMGTM